MHAGANVFFWHFGRFLFIPPGPRGAALRRFVMDGASTQFATQSGGGMPTMGNLDVPKNYHAFCNTVLLTWGQVSKGRQNRPTPAWDDVRGQLLHPDESIESIDAPFYKSHSPHSSPYPSPTWITPLQKARNLSLLFTLPKVCT